MEWTRTQCGATPYEERANVAFLRPNNVGRRANRMAHASQAVEFIAPNVRRGLLEQEFRQRVSRWVGLNQARTAPSACS
jgi:hypothetical protein